MSPNEIPVLLLGAIKKMGSIIKSTVRLPYFKTYMLLSVFFIILFTAVNFPYETIILKEIYRLEKKAYKSIIVGDFQFNLIGESSLSNLSLVLKNNDELSVDQLIADLDLSPFNFVSRKRIAGDINGQGIKYAGGKITLNCSASSNVDLELNHKSGSPETGSINVIVENALLRLDDITLPDSMGAFPLPPMIKASSIIINIDIRNQKILVKNFKISGPDLNATVSGNISLASFTKNSKLNLKVTVNGDSAVLKDFKPFLGKLMNDKGMISFPVKGTLGKPKPEINMTPPSPGI